ncbi:MAG: HepT-like ribonuclease domain-containing protein [Chloroflexota bacterium]
MERAQALTLLKRRKRRLKKFGVRSISLFGSVARNQARKRSDVDLLVEFERPIGLFEFARLQLYLEELFGQRVDLVTPEALRKELREGILREAIRAPRNWKMRVGDILECVAKIQRHTHGYGYDDFAGDDKTVDSVLRNLEIIGEATRHIPSDIKKRYNKLPWQEMQTMRNIVIHEYHGVNLKIIWQTVTEDLPPIIPQLNKILKEAEEK